MRNPCGFQESGDPPQGRGQEQKEELPSPSWAGTREHVPALCPILRLQGVVSAPSCLIPSRGPAGDAQWPGLQIVPSQAFLHTGIPFLREAGADSDNRRDDGDTLRVADGGGSALWVQESWGWGLED